MYKWAIRLLEQTGARNQEQYDQQTVQNAAEGENDTELVGLYTMYLRESWITQMIEYVST
jgi:hypothetical protein